MAIKVLKLKEDNTNTLELVEIVPGGSPDWTDVQNKPSTFPPSAHNHDASYSGIGHNHDGVYSALGHNHTGTYEPANSNIQAHVGSAHAPSNAQKNSDITKGEIEAKLTGEITSHTHPGGSVPDIVSQKLAPTGNTTIADGYGAYVPDRFEVVSGQILEIGVGSLMEIG